MKGDGRRGTGDGSSGAHVFGSWRAGTQGPLAADKATGRAQAARYPRPPRTRAAPVMLPSTRVAGARHCALPGARDLRDAYSGVPAAPPPDHDRIAVPNESLGRLFLRFLRFGFLAWGGPVAQIAMIREQLVERERWISRGRFNRVLAVYQALPGPEASELCVYFGMLARGRVGAVLAGVGFLLPGLALMLLLSWGYQVYGLTSPLWRGAMLGCQGAVAALIVRATIRIGEHAITTPMLWTLALGAVAAQAGGVNGVVVLLLAGVVHAALIRLRRGGERSRGAIAPLALVPGWRELAASLGGSVLPLATSGAPPALVAQATSLAPTLMDLCASGLRAGLLTFGGAYTAIPFLRADAVLHGQWMSDAQFLDGLALSSVLPAPFIIFSTFVGYLGGGLAGALVVTAAVFLPAFAFTLLGHDHLERVVETPWAHAFLDGVTAGVVGVIAVTAWSVGRGTLVSPLPVVTFVGAMVALLRFKAPGTVAWVMGGAAAAGILWAGQ